MRLGAFGHTVQSFNIDGTIAAQLVVHALSTDAWDAADLAPGAHQGTPASECRDGHGRAVSAIERIHVAGNVEQHETRTSYLATGEVASVTRQRLGFPDAPVVRWMQYDSLGRKVLNVDPNTTPSPMPAPGSDPATFRAWRYAYNDAGDLVGTSDARGCGVNFHYDAAGRALAEDYSPCLSAQADYSEPDFATGYGIETAYLYDSADPDSADLSVSTPGLTIAPNLLLGRLVSVADRGAKVLFQYDARGRTTGIAKRVALPGPPNDTPAKRYAARWYVSTASFDAADRPVSTSTGATAPELLGMGGASRVTTQYSKRGTVKSVGGSYGTLVSGVTRDANGLVTEIRYGDAAQTTTASIFDARLRLSTAQTYRAAASIWSSPPSGYTPPSTGPATLQLLLEDTELSYDEVDNPIQIRDWRDPSEWPDGAKPVHRTMQYDDLYRLSRVDMQYVGGDGWVSPFDAENHGATDPRRALPSPHVSFSRRIQSQSFAYDWLGNTVATDDDAQGFYDRSLGAITNGTAASGPYQLQYAANDKASPNAGILNTVYDGAGNLTSMSVERSGPCLPSGTTCTHRFVYDWDEVGRLARARRWESSSGAADSVPTATPDADLTYAYDSGNQRVIKTAADRSGEQRHTVYVFGSLELRRAEWDEKAEDYDDSALTEAPYLSANGARLARVAYDDRAPAIDGASLHVLLQVPDHLGSTGIVIDMATGELVERTTYQAYGSTESDYRPERWNAFREDYRFTGKEDDAEVGLTYFGQRYYAAGLGRWISPDPLAVHDLGADLNLYAYVHGKVFRAVDPVGLTEDEATQQSTLGNEYSDFTSGPPEPAVGQTAPTAPGAVGSSGELNWEQALKEGLAKGLWRTADLMSFGNLSIAETLWDAADPRHTISSVGVRALKIVPVLGNAISIGEGAGKLYDHGMRMSTDEKIRTGVDIAVNAVGLALAAKSFTAMEGPVTRRSFCFAEGTKVLMADGSTKSIEDVHEGDMILADDPEDESPAKPREVVKVHRNATYRLFHIEPADGGEIAATGSHPFWTQRGWVIAEGLTIEDVLTDALGRPVALRGIAVESHDAVTYNLSVEQDHTFFVVAGQRSILVHNVDPWDVWFTHDDVKPFFEHGMHKGRSLKDVAAEVRSLGRLPAGFELRAIRMHDGTWAALNNRTLKVARLANLPDVSIVDVGDAGMNKYNRNLRNAGLSGPVEDAFIRCE